MTREELHYQIAKTLAESDGIGEDYGYYRNYTREMFNTPKGKIDQDYKSVAGDIMVLVDQYKTTEVQLLIDELINAMQEGARESSNRLFFGGQIDAKA